MKPLRCVFLFCIALAAPFPVAAQKIAVLTPDNAERSYEIAEKLTGALGNAFNILDPSLVEAAYNSTGRETPFNLTTEESKRLGAAVGCDFFVLVKAETLRRSAFGRPEYYEAYAAIYLVSCRTGQLVLWRLPRFEASNKDAAARMLDAGIWPLTAEMDDVIRKTQKRELTAVEPTTMEEVPPENMPEARNFRAPIPYRRIKPEYPAEAAMFDVAATVDLIVDLNASGTILRTRVVRWAGFGLDESVERVVRSMNWRPAFRDGMPLPMRFLVRYNFKKIPNENAGPDK